MDTRKSTKGQRTIYKTYILFHFNVIFQSGSNSVPFIYGLSIYIIVVRDHIIKRGRVGNPLTGLIPPHCCACPKQNLDFQHQTPFLCYLRRELK